MKNNKEMRIKKLSKMREEFDNIRKDINKVEAYGMSANIYFITNKKDEEDNHFYIYKDDHAYIEENDTLDKRRNANSKRTGLVLVVIQTLQFILLYQGLYAPQSSQVVIGLQMIMLIVICIMYFNKIPKKHNETEGIYKDTLHQNIKMIWDIERDGNEKMFEDLFRKDNGQRENKFKIDSVINMLHEDVSKEYYQLLDQL